MLTVAEMIERIRAETNDEQETGYTDEDLVQYINDGVRFLRRTIFSVNPFLLVNLEQNGETEKGVDAITFEHALSHICSVRVNGVLLVQGNPLMIEDIREAGTPETYYPQGLNKIRLFPVPDGSYPYEVLGIQDVKRLKLMDDVSPFPDDFDDWLFEYATLRASMTHEFDMTQENSVMANIISQVQEALYSLSSMGVDPDGYPTSAYRGRQY